MNLDQYTDKVKSTLQAAQSAAVARGHQRFMPEHILYALLNDRDVQRGQLKKGIKQVVNVTALQLGALTTHQMTLLATKKAVQPCLALLLGVIAQHSM